MEIKDCNGKILVGGETVMPIEDLKVGGTNTVLKRGTKIKNIRLTDDSELVQCRIGKTTIYLKTSKIKKVG